VTAVCERFDLGEPEQIRCVRALPAGGVAEPEAIFGVARSGARVVVFDDVEKEFGIGVVEHDGVSRLVSRRALFVAGTNIRLVKLDL
jgi:hypothetical protein